MNAATLQILIKAKNEASAVLKGIGADAGGLSSKLGGLGKTMGAALKVGAVAGAGAIVGLGFALRGAVEEAIEAQNIMAQTAAVIKSTAGAAGLNAEEISKMANAFAKVTTFEDDAIQSAQNVLLTFIKIGKETFPEATEAVLNISTALKTDLQSASILVGKALNDPVKGMTALTRAGIQFTQQQKDQIRVMVETGDQLGAQRIILKELETQFGGSARAAAETFGGKMALLNNQINEVKEGIGMALLPILMSFADFANSTLVPAIQSGVDALQNFVTTFSAGLAGDVEKAADAFAKLPPPLQELALWLVKNKPQIEDMIKKVEDLADSMRRFSEDVLSGWVIILVALYPKLVQLGDWMKEHEDVATALAAALVAVAVVFGSTAIAIAAVIIAIGYLTDKINDSIDRGGYWAGVFDRAGQIIGGVAFVLRTMENALNTANDAVTRAGEAVNRVLTAALDTLVGALQSGWTGADNLSRAMNAANDAVTAAGRKVNEVLVAALNAVTGPMDWVTDRAYQMQRAFYAVRDAIQSAIDKLNIFDDIGGAIGGAVGRLNPRGFFAEGVINNARAQIGVVGERGPELMFVPQHASIFSAQQTKQMLADALGGDSLRDRTSELQRQREGGGRTLERRRGFASGVINNARAQVAMVGEAGRELMYVPRGASIFPAQQTRQMLAGTGGGNVYNQFSIEVHVEGDATNATVERIKRAVRDEAETAMREASWRGAFVTSGAFAPS